MSDVETRACPATGELRPQLSDDLLEGAAAIAAFVWGPKANRRKAYHAIENGWLPVFRLGNRVYARKSKLLAHIEAQENGGRR